MFWYCFIKINIQNKQFIYPTSYVWFRHASFWDSPTLWRAPRGPQRSVSWSPSPTATSGCCISLPTTPVGYLTPWVLFRIRLFFKTGRGSGRDPPPTPNRRGWVAALKKKPVPDPLVILRPLAVAPEGFFVWTRFWTSGHLSSERTHIAIQLFARIHTTHAQRSPILSFLDYSVTSSSQRLHRIPTGGIRILINIMNKFIDKIHLINSLLLLINLSNKNIFWNENVCIIVVLFCRRIPQRTLYPRILIIRTTPLRPIGNPTFTEIHHIFPKIIFNSFWFPPPTGLPASVVFKIMWLPGRWWWPGGRKRRILIDIHWSQF